VKVVKKYPFLENGFAFSTLRSRPPQRLVNRRGNPIIGVHVREPVGVNDNDCEPASPRRSSRS
jgi:hypothetical protein